LFQSSSIRLWGGGFSFSFQSFFPVASTFVFQSYEYFIYFRISDVSPGFFGGRYFFAM